MRGVLVSVMIKLYTWGGSSDIVSWFCWNTICLFVCLLCVCCCVLCYVLCCGCATCVMCCVLCVMCCVLCVVVFVLCVVLVFCNVLDHLCYHTRTLVIHRMPRSACSGNATSTGSHRQHTWRSHQGCRPERWRPGSPWRPWWPLSPRCRRAAT